MKLGTSQQAVLEWIKEHPGSTAQEIGDAIYDQTSACAEWQTDWSKQKVRRQWAAKLLGILLKKGLVEKIGRGIYRAIDE